VDRRDARSDLGRFLFREWKTQTTLAAGDRELKVRATANDRTTQPMEPFWNPAGYLRNVVETIHITAI
jgi:hypothetical protein